jgi:membrane protein
MTYRTILALFKRTYSDWDDDNAPRLGAALAFYTILSISPLVILVLAIVSLIFNRSSAQAHLLSQARSLVGMEGASTIQSLLEAGKRASTGMIASFMGLLTLVFGASGVFSELRSALNLIWDVKPKAGSGIWQMLRERIFSFGMVVSIGFVLLASLLASAALDAVTKFFSGLIPISPFVLAILDFVVSVTGIAILFGLILKYVPETKVQWSEVRVGAIATALFFTIGKVLLGLYLGKTTPGSPYGAAGSLVVMVIWVYYSAQIFYFGAEFTHVYACSKRAA